MSMLRIGDRVMVLDEDLRGVILHIASNKILVGTDDGFELTYLSHELLKIEDTTDLSRSITRHNIHDVLKEKQLPKSRSFVKEKKSRKNEFALEIDLHIEKLIPAKKGLSNYEILTIQTDTAIRQLEFAIKNRIPKVVFIHGVGEGVLKAELDFILGRYDGLYYQDADYQKYGLGATEVYIKQNR